MTSKYYPAGMPTTKKQALDMAMLREEWAIDARNRNRDDIAKEYELTAKLLYFIAKEL